MLQLSTSRLHEAQSLRHLLRRKTIGRLLHSLYFRYLKFVSRTLRYHSLVHGANAQQQHQQLLVGEFVVFPELSTEVIIKGEFTNLELKRGIVSMRFGGGEMLHFDVRHSGFLLRAKRVELLLELSNLRLANSRVVTAKLLSSLDLEQWIIAINRTVALAPLLRMLHRYESINAQQQGALALQQALGEGTVAVLAVVDKYSVSESDANALARLQDPDSGSWTLNDSLLQVVGLQHSVVRGITDELGVQAWANELKALLDSIIATSFARAYLISSATHTEATGRLSDRARSFLRVMVSIQPMMAPFAVGIPHSTWESFGIATLEQHSTKGIFARAKSLNVQSLVHHGIMCDGCRSSISGIRWKCSACEDYGATHPPLTLRNDDC